MAIKQIDRINEIKNIKKKIIIDVENSEDVVIKIKTNAVFNALIRDGWTFTAPITITRAFDGSNKWLVRIKAKDLFAYTDLNGSIMMDLKYMGATVTPLFKEYQRDNKFKK